MGSDPRRDHRTADITGTDDLERLEETEIRLVVELLPDGRIRAPAQPARELLRDRLRHAEVLRTGPGWAVFRGLDVITAQAPSASILGREIVAAGTIGAHGVSLIDYIGFLANGYETGVFSGASGDVERSVYFFKGDVVWASSTAPEDRLGEFLLRRGKITREQLQLAIADGSKKIGRACVERGFIAAHELWAMVQGQLTEIFDKLLATKSGLWTFSRVSIEALAESQINISTQGLLVDALRRLDEMQVYRKQIRSSDVLVQDLRRGEERGRPIAGVPKEVLEEATQLMWQIPGTATIHELMRILGKGEFEVTRVVHHLVKAKVLGIVETGESGPIPRRGVMVSKTQAREVIGIYSMAIREVFDEVRRLGRADELRRAVAEFLKYDSGPHGELLHSVSILPEGGLDEDSLLAIIQQGKTAQDLSDALSELLFFILFQVTDFLGRRRGDDLARRVKLIHGMLAGEGLPRDPEE